MEKTKLTTIILNNGMHNSTLLKRKTEVTCFISIIYNKKVKRYQIKIIKYIISRFSNR